MKMKRFLFILITLFSDLAFAYQSPFEISFEQGKIKAGTGQDVKTDVIIRIPSGHFIYKDKTDLSFTVLEGVHVKTIKYPECVSHVDPVTGKTVLIYPEGEAVISVVFNIPKTLPKGLKEVMAILEFQGCEEKLCLRPEEHVLTWKLDVTAFDAFVSQVPEAVIEKGRASINSLLNVKDFRSVIVQGRHVALLIAFIAGLLTSLTPCVWPLIPIMLLIIGVHKRGHFVENLILSVFLVMGIAVTYSILGVAASAAGIQMGFLFQQKIFLIFITAFLLLMSLSMFGIFTIQLPIALQNVLAKIGGKGYKGAFLSGISLGLLAMPCVGPVLGPMLVFIAAEMEYVFGVQLLAVYAFGMGVFYIVIGTFYGTFAGRLKNVKVGNLVKKILGVILLIPALYYLNSVIPFSGIFKNGIDWRYNEQAALIESVSTNKPLMIVFGARWCPPCIRLEYQVMKDKEVADAVKNLVPLYIDVTFGSDETNKILDKYNVAGWPTILFVAPNGRVYDDLSVVGEVPTTKELVKIINEAVKR